MAGYTGLASKVLRLLRTPTQQRRMNRTFAGLFIGAAAFMGQAVEYEIANVVDPSFTVVAKIRKSYLDPVR